MANKLLELLNKDQTDSGKIESWFDEIANELFVNSVLKVNDIELEFEEIEFYYFKYDIHPDEFTHQHERGAGMWRFHNAGVDITFKMNDQQDGGILIRGLKDSRDGKVVYINGPRNILSHIGECWKEATFQNSITVIHKELGLKKIYKTTRHGLSAENLTKEKEIYFFKKYRYITELKENKNLNKIVEADCDILE